MLAGSAEAAATLAAAGKGTLAIDGGTPVRKEMLQYRNYGPQFYDDVEKKELLEVLESSAPFRWRGEDSKVLQFEQAYAKHIGVKNALGVTSGTTALYTAMAALEIGPGDEVILPAWTWYADYDAIVLAGALPVFVEIDESFNIDVSEIEAKITPRTKAIIAVHLQGCTADMDPDSRNRPQAQAESSGGLRPMPGWKVQRKVRRFDRRHWHQQLPTEQEHHVGRGRRCRDKRSASSSSGPFVFTMSARFARPTRNRLAAACWQPLPPATSG